MAVKKIVYIPDSRLRKETRKVDVVDSEIQTLIEDMFETMYAARGVGLAAPQIGISKKIAVIDPTGEKSQQLVLINPEIIAAQGEEEMQEGCLSVPGVFDTVKRASKVTLRALDREGQVYELEAKGLLAEIIQHEIDHLNGTLFIDQLSALKRERIRKKFEKYKRQSSS
jgi:peptide deformylase